MEAVRKKQALCIATVASMLDNFNRSNADILLNMGYEVTLAANFQSREDINSQEKTDAFAKEMRAKGIHIVQVDFSRSIKNASMHVKAMLQVRKLLKRQFDLIHCHSPICAAMVRLQACTYRKKYGTKVYYTAHGFHFFKGAPLRNWLVFYPAEKFLSRLTDVLITVNREDYRQAKERFHAGKTAYIPGVGIDLEKFCKINPQKDAFRLSRIRQQLREDYGVQETDIILLSVGELNKNKNHALAIRALAQLKDEPYFPRLKYLICGKGSRRDYLINLAGKLNLGQQVCLTGYRKDTADMYKLADVFLFLSKREGLPVSLMEAMASGVPVIVTNVRGNTDLVRNGREGYVTGFEESEVAGRIKKAVEYKNEKMGIFAAERIRKFDQQKVNRKMRVLYGYDTYR